MPAAISTDPLSDTTPQSLSIRARLIVGFGTTLLMLVITISFILFKAYSVKSFASSVLTTHIPTLNAYRTLNVEIANSYGDVITWLITHDDKLKESLNASWRHIDAATADLELLSKNWQGREAQILSTVKTELADLKKGEDEIIASGLNNTNKDIALIANKVLPIKNRIYDLVNGKLDENGLRIGGLYNDEYMLLQNGSRQIVNSINIINESAFLFLIIGAIISALVGYYVTIGIVTYIKTFRVHSNRIAQGDLRERLKINNHHDELGLLGGDLNLMTDSLANITQRITEASHNMVTTFEEVRHAIDVQSSGASEQASSINEITASLEEIEKNSSQTLEKAKSLGVSAERTRQTGKEGLDAVEHSILGMKDIRNKVQLIAQTILDLSAQTQQVGEITAVVNTLAQQSKMLALNASIEAAKAGESGRGFAVVAAEIKNLAEQSEQSTAQVQKILESIRHATEQAVLVTEEGTKGVDRGTTLVEQTGNVFRNLSEVIHETTIATQHIESAIMQENIGIEQITTGMNEIHQVTSSFVESIRQTTEAIGNLADIANSLKTQIDFYKI